MKNNLIKMLPALIFAGSIFFVIQQVSAQQIQFANTYLNFGVHYSYGFTELPDSGFIIVGSSRTTASDPRYSFAMRIKKHGDTLWTKNYLSNQGAISDIVIVNDSICLLAGGFVLNGGLSLTFEKINLNGDTINRWEYGYSNQGPAGDINKTLDGGFITNNAISLDYAFLKLDSSLNVQWHNYNDMQIGCSEIKPDYDNGYIAVGGQYGMEPYVIKKLDSAGTTIWQHNHGNTLSSPTDELFASDVCVMADSNYLVGTNGSDWQLMKINHITGDTVWTKNYDTITNYRYNIYCMDSAGNNNYILATTNYLMLIDANGDSIWRKENPFRTQSSSSELYDVHKTSDGGYAFCGYYVHLVSPTYIAIAFIKLDSLGNTILTSVYEIPDSHNADAKVYPNPFNETAVIKISNTYANKKCDLKITDISGHDVTSLFTPEKINAAEYAIHAANVANGFYFVTVNDGERKKTTSFSVLK